MRCWKCGQELMDGTGVCTYCGASQVRPEPVTAAGRAMRSLYDRYGAREVLTNGAYLTSGLSDLLGTDDSKKLRNQIKMATDAGMGRIYLEQLSIGAPDNNFDRRVKALLTEDAGLNDNVADELAGYFDEMIGWRVISQSGVPPYTPPPNTGEKPFSPDGIKKTPKPEIDRQQELEMGKPAQERRFRRKGFYLYELALLVWFFMVLSAYDGELNLNPETALGLLVFPLLMSFAVTKRKVKRIGSIPVGLFVAYLMIIFCGFTLIGLCSMLANQKFVGGELFFLCGLMSLQMIRHRILESKLPKT